MKSLNERMKWIDNIARVHLDFDAPEKYRALLVKNKLPEKIVIVCTDKSDRTLATTILQTAQFIASAAKVLNVDPLCFHSEIDLEQSDHEDNAHIINFLPVAEEGALVEVAYRTGTVFGIVVAFGIEGESYTCLSGMKRVLVSNTAFIRPVDGKGVLNHNELLETNWKWLKAVDFNKVKPIEG